MLTAVLVADTLSVCFLEETVVLETVKLVVFSADLTLDKELYNSRIWGRVEISCYHHRNAKRTLYIFHKRLHLTIHGYCIEYEECVYSDGEICQCNHF